MYMAKNQSLADILKIIKFKSNLNQSEIADQIGVSKQYLSDTLNCRYQFSDDLRQRLYEQFTYLEKEKPSNNEKIIDNMLSKTPSQINEDKTQNEGTKYRMVPILNIDSVGGMHTNASITDEPQYILGFIPFVGAFEDDICINESGNSMTPTIPPGSLLLLRNVPEWREYFGYGSIFVIELKDGRRVTKEVRRSEDNSQTKILCHSHAVNVQDEELPKSMIVSVWKVVKVLTNLGY
jgi:transcriptional regulator with XRE-family HTH domain